MKKLFVLSFAILCGFSQSSFAFTNNCFERSRLEGYDVIDDSHLIFNVRGGGKVEFTLGAGCDLRAMDFFAFDSFSDFQVCGGDKLMTFQQDAGPYGTQITGSCLIDDIVKQ